MKLFDEYVKIRDLMKRHCYCYFLGFGSMFVKMGRTGPGKS